MEFEFEEDDIPKIDKIKKIVDSFEEDLKKQMLSHKVIPLRYDDNIKDKIILAAVDPTVKEIPKIAYNLNAKSYEVVYIPISQYEKLIEILIPPENEYLKNISEEVYDYKDVKEESSIDEGL